MANFAKAQLLKYGWTEGKGLGKNENGIQEAIRPKLKFDNAGIGHDPTEQFTNHWWENVFNEAAKNIQVKSENDGVSMKVINEDTVDITTKKSSVKALIKSHDNKYAHFLKTSTLLNDGKVVAENPAEHESMDSLAQKINHVQLTDEDLFKACGGRTAHKGARHGLNLNGKLARIAEQERQLLSKTNLSKEEKNNSNISSGKDYGHDFELVKSRKRVKSKRKMIKTDHETETNIRETVSVPLVNCVEDPQPSCSYSIDHDAGNNSDVSKSKRKSKKSKKNNNCEHNLHGNHFREFVSRNPNFIEDGSSGVDVTRSNLTGLVDDNANTIEHDDEFMIPLVSEEPRRRTKSKKTRKKDKRKMNELMAKLDASCVIDESVKIGRKRIREEGRQIVEDILTSTLEKCGPPPRKCKKIKTEESSYCSTYDADKLNAKILKRKKHSHKKKRRDKSELVAPSCTDDFISNSDVKCVEVADTAKKELCQSLSDHETHDSKHAQRRCHRHKSN